MRLAALFVVGLLLAVACSSESREDASWHGHVVVVEVGGGLSLVDPETADKSVLATSEVGAVQPVWSPDGGRLAWTEVVEGEPALVVAEGDDRSRVSTPFVSFYNHWDPLSSQVASLGSRGGDVELAVSSVDAEDALRLATGQPLFLSWRDDGEQLALKTDGSLRVVDLDGTVAFETEVSNAFQAPIWLPGSDEVIVVVDRPDAASIAAINVKTGVERNLMSISGLVSMVLDPDGGQLALVHTAAEGEVVTASFPSSPAQGPAASGTFVIDVSSGAVQRIADALRGALFWSPEGDWLLSLALDQSGGPAPFRWEVHDLEGNLVGRSDRMVPSATMNQSYLPFADQYAQAYTPWSPDGRRFAFAGAVGGDSGIWIQAADGDGGSERLSDGEFAAWSPR